MEKKKFLAGGNDGILRLLCFNVARILVREPSMHSVILGILQFRSADIDRSLTFVLHRKPRREFRFRIVLSGWFRF